MADISANNIGNEKDNNQIYIFANNITIEKINIIADIRCSGLNPRGRQNESQKPRFHDFLALSSEVDETSPRRLNLMTFCSWL